MHICRYIHICLVILLVCEVIDFYGYLGLFAGGVQLGLLSLAYPEGKKKENFLFLALEIR